MKNVKLTSNFNKCIHCQEIDCITLNKFNDAFFVLIYSRGAALRCWVKVSTPLGLNLETLKASRDVKHCTGILSTRSTNLDHQGCHFVFVILAYGRRIFILFGRYFVQVNPRIIFQVAGVSKYQNSMVSEHACNKNVFLLT